MQKYTIRQNKNLNLMVHYGTNIHSNYGGAGR